MSIIELSNVSKTFKKTGVLLSNIFFSFEAGKIYSIVGNNGCGKSVLIKMICGFINPSNGIIKVNQKVIGVDVDFAQNVGIIIETPNFLSTETAFNNLKYLASIRNKINDKKIEETLELVGLSEYTDKYVKNFSLGMKQKLGIAQAIMEDPEILILDEPFNALDQISLLEMKKLLVKLKNLGKSIIMTSHHYEDISSISDCILCISNKVLKEVEINEYFIKTDL